MPGAGGRQAQAGAQLRALPAVTHCGCARVQPCEREQGRQAGVVAGPPAPWVGLGCGPCRAGELGTSCSVPGGPVWPSGPARAYQASTQGPSHC